MKKTDKFTIKNLSLQSLLWALRPLRLAPAYAGQFMAMQPAPSSTSTQQAAPAAVKEAPVAPEKAAAIEPAEPAPMSRQPDKKVEPRKPFFDRHKAMPAFWTVASILSMTVNLILILVLVLLGRELFVLKTIVGEKLLGGLYENFIYMDLAHIKTDITVADTIPINFSLPISQDTIVVLTADTQINGAMVRLNSGGVSINSPANIVLPAGTNLPVHLELVVPVNTNVPINIKVPVDIPLEQTELHKPFIGLQQVVAPFYGLLQPQIKGPEDIPACQPFSGLCTFFFQK